MANYVKSSIVDYFPIQVASSTSLVLTAFSKSLWYSIDQGDNWVNLNLSSLPTTAIITTISLSADGTFGLIGTDSGLYLLSTLVDSAPALSDSVLSYKNSLIMESEWDQSGSLKNLINFI